MTEEPSWTAAAQRVLERTHGQRDEKAAHAVMDNCTVRQMLVIAATLSASCLAWLLEVVVRNNHDELS